MGKKVDGIGALPKLLDVKLFGGMVPDVAKVIGAVHCDWASSLHPIKIEEATITSAFSSAEKKTVGTMGRKYFVPYGLYGASFTYSASRAREFGNYVGDRLTVRDMELFEEGLLNGASHGRTGMKGYVEPLFVLKVVKDEKVKSRFDYLAEEVQVNVTGYGEVHKSSDVELNMKRLYQALANKDYVKVQAYVSPSGLRRYKELAHLNKKFGGLTVCEDDLDSSWEYIVVYEVKHSNPNGDPDMDNMPRRFEGTDIGMISPERQKRWIRDYLEDQGELIFITRRGKVQKAKDRLKEIEDLI